MFPNAICAALEETCVLNAVSDRCTAGFQELRVCSHQQSILTIWVGFEKCVPTLSFVFCPHFEKQICLERNRKKANVFLSNSKSGNRQKTIKDQNKWNDLCLFVSILHLFLRVEQVEKVSPQSSFCTPLLVQTRLILRGISNVVRSSVLCAAANHWKLQTSSGTGSGKTVLRSQHTQAIHFSHVF